MSSGKEWLGKMKKGELSDLAEHLKLSEYVSSHLRRKDRYEKRRMQTKSTTANASRAQIRQSQEKRPRGHDRRLPQQQPKQARQRPASRPLLRQPGPRLPRSRRSNQKTPPTPDHQERIRAPVLPPPLQTRPQPHLTNPIQRLNHLPHNPLPPQIPHPHPPRHPPRRRQQHRSLDHHPPQHSLHHHRQHRLFSSPNSSTPPPSAPPSPLPPSITLCILLLEAWFLRAEILPLRYLTTIPAIPALGVTWETAIKIPDLFALLTGAFWGPFGLWVLTSVGLPAAGGWFVNLTRGEGRKQGQGVDVDAVSFNVVKAVVAWVVYVNGGVGGESTGMVERGVPGGARGLIVGAVVGGVAGLYEAVLRK